MLVAAEATSLLGFPWVWSKMVDVVQKERINPSSLHHLLMLLLLPIGLQILFWSIHDPARFLERVNAFKIRANYRYAELLQARWLEMTGS